MITCANCGKTNQPTRKYCIRCGHSLLKVSSKVDKPVSSVPELGTVTTEKTLKAKAEQAKTSGPPTSSTTDDRWVKPSSVSRDRVRTTGKRIEAKSESEKAREIFEKAMTYGIDETGTGVVETRMLRASEVKDLLESPAPADETTSETEPTIAPGQTTPPERASQMAASRASHQASEERILGVHSGFVRSPEEEAPEIPEPAAPPPDTSEFTSSRYGSIPEEAVEPPPPPTIPEPARTEEESLEFEELPSGLGAKPKPVSAVHEHTAVCTSCGSVMHLDDFSYPVEVYSVMGEARLKQARFYVVQGKYEDAKRIISVAQGLFTKANDNNGLAQVEKLAHSLERSG